MAVKVTDLRCSGCGKKLAEAVGVTRGEVRIQCPRCHKRQSIAVNTTE